MLSRKSPKGDLERKKTTFGLIGMIFVLGLIYVGFELFATQNPPSVPMFDTDVFIEIDETTPIVDNLTPPPPKEILRDPIIRIVNKEIKEMIDLSKIFSVDPDLYPYNPDDYTIDLLPEPTEPAPPLLYPEVMPEFPGGEAALHAFLIENLIYPEEAKRYGIQGIVIVDFIVETDGRVGDVKLFLSDHPSFNQEAIRVIKMLPKFSPGMVMNKPVRTMYRQVISFKSN